MRILADSNIFIDIWKGKEPEKYRQVFTDHEIIVCGVVQAELVQGAYSEKNRKEILENLALFTHVNLNDWDALGDYLYELRIHGVSVPFQDAMIATIAMEYDLPVWTNDRHFEQIMKIIPGLKLANEEDLHTGNR